MVISVDNVPCNSPKLIYSFLRINWSNWYRSNDSESKKVLPVEIYRGVKRGNFHSIIMGNGSWYTISTFVNP